MAIRRISELDMFTKADLSQFLSTVNATDSSLVDPANDIPNDKVYDPAKLSAGIWFEVSTPLEGLSCENGDLDANIWKVKPVNEAPSYYLSKKINGNDIAKFFLWKFEAAIEQIISGPINYYGSQTYGDPISSANDGIDEYWYDNRPYIGTENNPNRLCVMVSADFTNQTTFHGPIDFHNNVDFYKNFVFHGKHEDSDYFINFHNVDGPYKWNQQDITLKGPWAEFDQDIVVDGDAYLNNAFVIDLSANEAHFTDLKVDNDIDGTCLRARWADLAENYESDHPYPPGTLVKFGGEKEITIADDYANAVITSKPGFSLNSNATKDNLGIALVGRVPVRVVGKVRKFDRIGLSEKPGIGKTVKKNHIGIALESSDIEAEKLVECVVQMSL